MGWGGKKGRSRKWLLIWTPEMRLKLSQSFTAHHLFSPGQKVPHNKSAQDVVPSVSATGHNFKIQQKRSPFLATLSPYPREIQPPLPFEETITLLHHPRKWLITPAEFLFPPPILCICMHFYNVFFHELLWFQQNWSWLNISETIYTFLPNSTVPWKPSNALVQALCSCLLR